MSSAVTFDPSASYAPVTFDPNGSYEHAAVLPPHLNAGSPTMQKAEAVGLDQPMQSGPSPIQQAWADIKAGRYSKAAIDTVENYLTAATPLLMATGVGEGLAAAGGGLRAAAPTIVRTVGGGVMGGAAGSYAGGRIGEAVGGETGRRYGEALGGLVGGVAGGGEAYRTAPEVPETGPAVPITKSPYYNAEEYKAGRKLGPSGTPPTTTVPKATTQGVTVLPEPRAPAVGQKPGSMYSVPRSQLVASALRGDPGAADVLRDLGRPQIIIPRGADIESPALSQLKPSVLPSAYDQFKAAD